MFYNVGMEETNTQEQTNNRPWLYKKGQSGNPGGRPKGSISLKTWLRNKFATMTDEEREEFFEGMNKIDLFKMAEGNPETKSDITSNGKTIVLPVEILNKHATDQSPINSSQIN